MTGGESLARLEVDAAAGLVLAREALTTWARRLGQCLPRGAVLALHGELGAGKTTFVRALAEGLGVDDLSEVSSPTYAIVHEYATSDGAMLHADFYRLRTPAELEQLGWDEAVAGARAAVIEWPERAPSAIPAEAWHLHLDHVAGRPEVRSLQLRPIG